MNRHVRRWVLPVGLLVLGLIVSVGGGWLTQIQVDRSLDARFGVAADRAASVVELQLQRYATMAGGVAVIAATDQDQDGWMRLARELAEREDAPPVLSVEAMSLITADELDDYLQRQRRDVTDGFMVTPPPDGRSELAVVDRSWSRSGERALIGTDALASPPRRPGVERALATGAGSFSDAFTLDDSVGLVVYAVFDDAGGEPAGFGSISLSGQEVMEDRSARLPDLRVTLTDPQTPSGITHLGTLHGDWEPGSLMAEREVVSGGQRLTLDITAASDGVAPWEARAGVLTGAFLFLLTLLVAGVVGAALGGEQRAQQLVDRRTEELRDTNSQLREAVRARDDFLAKVSHEFRTPLTSILGFAETAVHTDDGLSPTTVGLVERIVVNARRLERLVDDLLSAAANREQRVAVEPVVVDVAAAIEEARSEQEHGRTDVTVEVAADLRALVDADHLHRVLENLLSNARKYGRPPVVVTAVREVGEVVLRVRDHGDGIPENLRDQIFSPFTQADEGDGRTVTGVGLGLSIVQDLALANNGSVEVAPWSDSGACLEVRLPVAD